MTHKQAVLRFDKTYRSKRNGDFVSIVTKNGKIIASGVDAKQAWYCARIILSIQNPESGQEKP
jgi:hypothetical protein